MTSTKAFWRGLVLSAALLAASLSYAEAAPRKGDAALAAFDTDKDGTLSWNEVSAAASAKFAAADTDHEGTLSRDELSSKQGEALLRLMM